MLFCRQFLQRLFSALIWKILDQAKNIKEAVSLAETLEKTDGRIDWPAGMQILRDVSQKGTTRSVVYSLPTKEPYFSVYQNWNTIYHLKPF